MRRLKDKPLDPRSRHRHRKVRRLPDPVHTLPQILRRVSHRIRDVAYIGVLSRRGRRQARVIEELENV
jgi:hypothetical protein